MRNEPHKTLIGLFVVGAITLLLTILAVLGTGWFVTEKVFVMYFGGSVMGLNPGAPVTFKGVRVGSVSRVSVRYDPTALLVLVPVYVDIDMGKIGIVGEPKTAEAYQIEPLIAKGLRAQLQTVSYVTGQLVVALDFFPDTPVHLTGIDRRYPEIPTVPSRIEELSRTLRELPLADLTKSLLATAKGIEKLVGTPGLEESAKSLNRTLERVARLAEDLEAKAGPLMESITKTSEETRSTLTGVRQSLEKAEIEEAVRDLRHAAKEADKLFGETRELVSRDSRLFHDLQSTMEDIAGAARSMRDAADYIERHPEALIRGKRGR